MSETKTELISCQITEELAMNHSFMKVQAAFLAMSLMLLPGAVLAQGSGTWCPAGTKAFEARNYDDANLKLSSCLHSPPEDPQAAADGYYMRGVTYLEREDYVAALGDFDLSIERLPEHAPAWQKKAWVHYKNNELHPAIEAIGESVRLDSTNTESHHIHALILIAMGRDGLAVDSFDLAYSFERSGTVKQLQQSLRRLGYNVGAVDGNYGGRTRNALKSCITDRCSFML